MTFANSLKCDTNHTIGAYLSLHKVGRGITHHGISFIALASLESGQHQMVSFSVRALNGH